MRLLPTPRSIALALLGMQERGLQANPREVSGVFSELDDTGQAVLCSVSDDEAAAWACDMLAAPNRPLDCENLIDVSETAHQVGYMYNVALSMALGDAIQRHVSFGDNADKRLKRVLAAGLTHSLPDPCFTHKTRVSVTLRYFDGSQWRHSADLRVAIEPRAADDMTPTVVIRLAHE